MRVCHVSPHLPPDQAANALLPAELGAWARARGDVVTYVAHEPAQGRSASDRDDGRPRVARAAQAEPYRPSIGCFDWKRSRQARRHHGRTWTPPRATRISLHLHSNGLIVEVASAWARRQRVPAVLTLYGTEIWHYRARWPIDPFTRAYRAAADVTFYSRRLLERAQAIGLDRPRLTVVYPAVSPAFTPHDDAGRAALRAGLGIAEPLVVLNVKRLHELAGQTYLIDAFARVARGRDDVRLVICGTGPLRQSLEAQARVGRHRVQVTFAGLVSNDQVARYAAAADVFVLPSLLEALPTVAVEALAPARRSYQPTIPAASSSTSCLATTCWSCRGRTWTDSRPRWASRSRIRSACGWKRCNSYANTSARPPCRPPTTRSTRGR